MERNLPAAPEEASSPATEEQAPPVTPRPPVSIAFLPLALVMFIVAAFTIAAWTFLATAF